MTTSPFTSEWYRILVNYKRGHPELWQTPAALTLTFLNAHATEIEELLGGPYDLVTPVPSKRGIPYERQPLQRVLRGIGTLGDALSHTLEYRSAAELGRWRYDPQVFEAGPVRVRGRRVLLIEDTWVTGATCLSAAGALLELGSASVMVLPLARCIDEEFWRDRSPDYLAEIAADYHHLAWPR